MLDVIHASCLLSTYFYTQNRVQEGYYHSTAAARLMATLGSYVPGYSTSWGAYNAHKRISTLVHVFSVDRSWSVVTGLPPALRDEDCIVPSVMECLTGFPAGLSVSSSAGSRHPSSYLWVTHHFQDAPGCEDPPPADRILNVIALRLSAYALHETSHRLVPTGMDQSIGGPGSTLKLITLIDQSPRNQEDIATLKSSVVLFHKRFPSFVRSKLGLEPLRLVDAHMAAIHTFVNASTINLERNAMTRGGEPFKRCLLSVSSMVGVIEQLQEEDYPSLDPLMSVGAPHRVSRAPLLIASQSCWVTAANVCLYVISSSRPPENTEFVQTYADVLIGAVLQLARFYPLAGEWCGNGRHRWVLTALSNQRLKRYSCCPFNPS